jgi:hypothetical protein
MSFPRFPIVRIWLALALAAGCAQVLGIEDADCDPSYSSDCVSDGVQSGNGGSGTFGPTQMVTALMGGSGGAPGSGGSATAMTGSATGSNGTGGASGSNAAGAMGGAAGGSMVSSAGAAGGGSMPPDPIVARASQLCIDYCNIVQASCTGTSAQYASPLACLAVCEQLPAGTAGATTGNSVQCRIGRAQLAPTTGEAANYCYSAGPGGGGVCGSDCEGYCTLMTAKCTQLGSLSQCRASCSIVPDLSLPPTNKRYDASQQSGDSLQCRLFHVSAATVDPAMHCTHAAGEALCI